MAHMIEVEAAQRALEALEQDAQLYAAEAFVARAKALDELEFPILAALTRLGADGDAGEPIVELLERADALQRRLRQANERVCAEIRMSILRGDRAPGKLRRLFESFVVQDTAGIGEGELSYDALDELVAGVLQIEPPEYVDDRLEAEMVGYQPTPARIVLQLIEQAGIGPDDVLYDIGAGSGQVAMLVALLTGAACVGIELQELLCASARRCATRLNLTRVRFVCADARDAELGDGTIFFLYTPFRGALLKSFLARLRQQAALRPIRVCTYGPDLESVANQPWLRRVALHPEAGSQVAVLASRPVGAGSDSRNK